MRVFGEAFVLPRIRYLLSRVPKAFLRNQPPARMYSAIEVGVQEIECHPSASATEFAQGAGKVSFLVN